MQEPDKCALCFSNEGLPIVWFPVCSCKCVYHLSCAADIARHHRKCVICRTPIDVRYTARLVLWMTLTVAFRALLPSWNNFYGVAAYAYLFANTAYLFQLQSIARYCGVRYYLEILTHGLVYVIAMSLPISVMAIACVTACVGLGTLM